MKKMIDMYTRSLTYLLFDMMQSTGRSMDNCSKTRRDR